MVSVNGTSPKAGPSNNVDKEMDKKKAIEEADKLIDMKAPLVFQIEKLNKRQYIPWVHEPYTFLKEKGEEHARQARLLPWDLLEPLTYTRWWVIPLIWIPASLYLWSFYIFSPEFSLTGAAGIFAFGMCLWTFLEYSIHRYIFHLDDFVPDHPVALTLHFLLHGVHHKVPMDRFRLVMPPVLFAILASCVYAVVRPIFAFLSQDVFLALFASGILGYVAYDMVHYSQHHSNPPKDSYWAKMKQYHMKHHWSGLHNVGYGITSKFWDKLFGTELVESMWKTKAAPKATISKDE